MHLNIVNNDLHFDRQCVQPAQVRSLNAAQFFILLSRCSEIDKVSRYRQIIEWTSDKIADCIVLLDVNGLFGRLICCAPYRNGPRFIRSTGFGGGFPPRDWTKSGLKQILSLMARWSCITFIMKRVHESHLFIVQCKRFHARYDERYLSSVVW